MSEEDVIREALDALTEAVANARWSAWDRPEAVRLKALAQLDSLTTRLTEAEREVRNLMTRVPSELVSEDERRRWGSKDE